MTMEDSRWDYDGLLIDCTKRVIDFMCALSVYPWASVLLSACVCPFVFLVVYHCCSGDGIVIDYRFYYPIRKRSDEAATRYLFVSFLSKEIDKCRQSGRIYLSHSQKSFLFGHFLKTDRRPSSSNSILDFKAKSVVIKVNILTDADEFIHLSLSEVF